MSDPIKLGTKRGPDNGPSLRAKFRVDYPQLEMRSLLELAGFKVYSTRRADCAYCDGNSRRTVSFTEALAYCHRCKWRANVLILARQLGLLDRNRETISAVRQQAAITIHLDSVVKPFESWREERIREVSDQYRTLSKSADRAKTVLQVFPNCEPAWDALARFYHQEGSLSAAFDWLMFMKASAWLEGDSKPADVFETWRHHVT